MNNSEYDLSKLMENSNTIIVPNGYFNYDNITSFKITNNRSLKRIEIGENCYGKVRVFDLDGLSELESVVIGQKSFRISDDERNDGSYRIVNCPKLKSIDMGEYCFHYAPSFSLTGLINGLV